jgi:D-alanine-D-alanine ligase-like ATP-grasp enzyme
VYDQNVVSYLELLHVPYTGCNPRGLMLARDKVLSKKLFSFHRIPFPDFMVVPQGRTVKRPKWLSFPLIVKSATEEASLGISQASIVQDDDKLKERVEFIHESVGTGALIERYIEGRELYVGVMGNGHVHVLPVWEPDHGPVAGGRSPDCDRTSQMESHLSSQVWDSVSKARIFPKGRPRRFNISRSVCIVHSV